MSFCCVLMVKWSPTALLSTWDSWGSHLASLTSTYNLLQPPACKVESSFSWGDLSHARWQGRNSPEDFSLSLSSLLSPFLSVLFPTSLCPLLQWSVWPNLAFVKNLSFRRVTTWFIWRLPPGCLVSKGLYSYRSLAFSHFLVFVPFMIFSLPVYQTNCYLCREGAVGHRWDCPEAEHHRMWSYSWT